MQPLIVVQQISERIIDFLQAAFPSSINGFTSVVERLLAPRNLALKVLASSSRVTIPQQRRPSDAPSIG